MVLKYRVSLPGIKGFARVYELRANSSLYTFSKQMRADMGFPQDQMVLFKAMDKDGNVDIYLRLFGDINTKGLEISGLIINGKEYNGFTISSTTNYSWIFSNLGGKNPATDECKPELLVPKSA